ncbi:MULTISPECIES: hypothetical protein [unclassified Streptomyces]|uniref:hypothetical protein n=1 Tax=unclassified Streptomyces TaxID=2593676 RepID=UPI0036E9BA05
MRGVTRTALGAVATGVLVLAMSNPAAAADESDTGVASSAPTSGTCVTEIQGARACFKPDGDVIYAKDTSLDGWSVYASWENQLRNSSGTWKTYRTGKCWNNRGEGDWVSCNKDFYENSTSPNALGGTGSRIILAACVDDLGDDTCYWGGPIYNSN